MPKNTKQSSKKIASEAAKVLISPNASKTKKALAASVLSQRSTSNQTSSQMETLASTVARSSKYDEQSKSFAGSVLSQSNKDR